MTRRVLTGNRCECPACGELFSRVRAFDRHRGGPFADLGKWEGGRRCLTPAEMKARGWSRNGIGAWVIEVLDGAGRTRARASGEASATPAPPDPKNGPSSLLPALSRGLP